MLTNIHSIDIGYPGIPGSSGKHGRHGSHSTPDVLGPPNTPGLRSDRELTMPPRPSSCTSGKYREDEDNTVCAMQLT